MGVTDAIHKADPYMDLYKFQKATDPSSVILARAFRKADVEAVDKLLELGKGSRETVKTDNDWNVLANVIVFFIQRWPSEWEQFRSSMPEIRETRRAGGYSRSKEIRYVAALPPRLERLIKIMFPYQQYDKKFMNQLIRRFKAFRVGGEGN